MNDVALAIEEARSELAVAAAEFLPDACDIDGPIFVEGGASGDSVSFGSVVTNEPCKVKSLGGGRQIVIGGQAYTLSHRLQMRRTATTVAITPRHKITVRARGNTAQRVFENPIVDEDSMDALLWVNATLVAQGYQL